MQEMIGSGTETPKYVHISMVTAITSVQINLFFHCSETFSCKRIWWQVSWEESLLKSWKCMYLSWRIWTCCGPLQV